MDIWLASLFASGPWALVLTQPGYTLMVGAEIGPAWQAADHRPSAAEAGAQRRGRVGSPAMEGSTKEANPRPDERGCQPRSGLMATPIASPNGRNATGDVHTVSIAGTHRHTRRCSRLHRRLRGEGWWCIGPRTWRGWLGPRCAEPFLQTYPNAKGLFGWNTMNSRVLENIIDSLLGTPPNLYWGGAPV